MTQPKYAKVDPADYKRLRKYEWSAKKSHKSFYAFGRIADNKTEKAKTKCMHREVIKVPDGMLIDHINHDSMDNRRANLRAATFSQNMRNRKKRSDAKSSKYKGVCRFKGQRKWVARITFEKKRIYLGDFENEIDAAKAYDEAAKKYHKEFAVLNFPD